MAEEDIEFMGGPVAGQRGRIRRPEHELRWQLEQVAPGETGSVVVYDRGPEIRGVRQYLYQTTAGPGVGRCPAAAPLATPELCAVTWPGAGLEHACVMPMGHPGGPAGEPRVHRCGCSSESLGWWPG